jgi:YbbR domain-containing protein
MVNKILKTLSKNLGLKILALAFAFTLWITVYNLDDPTKTKQFTANVTVTNKEVLEELGKYYEIKDGMNKVVFSVTSPRSILDKLDSSDFTAEANLQKMVIDEDGVTGVMPIEVFCTANVNMNSLKITSSSKNLIVALDDLMTKQFVVQAKAIGEVAEGYALGKVEVTAPNVLKVSGPKSIVSQIQSAVVTVDVSDMSDSSTTYRDTPILLDANGSEVDTTRLTLSDTLVNVEAEILNVKEVSISVIPTGTVAEGYKITDIQINPSTVFLKGSKTILNSISTIQIPSDILNVEGAQKDVTVAVDVSEYIPDNAELVVSEQATVQVTVVVNKIKTKSFSVNTEDIKVTGLQNHAVLEYELSSIAVNVIGLEEDINGVTERMLKGSIDVTELGYGTHEVEVFFDLDESKYTCDKVVVVITITEENQETDESQNTNESEETDGTEDTGTE